MTVTESLGPRGPLAAPAAPPPEALLDAAEFCARSASVRFDPSRVRAGVTRALSDADREAPSWSAALAAASESVGVRCERVDLSALDVVSRRELPLPLVTMHARGWCAVTARTSRRARVRLDGQPERWVTPRELALAVGASDASESLPWVVAAPASPLAPLDGHGADGHGRSPFARVRALLRLERDDLWVVLVYATATGLLSLATPVAAQALVSTVAFGSLLQPVAVLTALLFTVLSTAALLRALQVRVVEALQQRVFVRVALEVAHRLPRASASARDGAHGPEQVNRFFDVLTLQKSAAVFLLDALGLVLQTAIGLVVLAFYHPLLLAFDVVLIACVAALLFGMGRGATRTSIAESKAKYAVAAWLEEVARMPYALRSRSGAEHAAASADAATRAYLDARRAHFSVVYRQIVGSLALQAVASAALLGVGGALVIARQLTLGQLVAAEIIVTMVVASLAKLGKHLETWYDLMAAADKLGHLLDLEVEAAPSQPAASAEGPAALRVRGVRVEGGPRLDLDLAPGGRAVITAPSGAGKTRLAEALCGLRAPTEGVVELDGLDARELDPLARREATALVGGEVEVFAGTVRENVSLGRPQVGAREVWGALAAVGVDEAVRALPQGLDAKLLPSGAPLSQSQARLVGLARALAGSPRLLVLDDALSGLDPRGRRRAEEAVMAPSAPWTLVVLSREAMSAPRGVVALSLAAPTAAPAARGDA